MDATLGRLLPAEVPEDFEDFSAMTVPAVIECSNCVVTQADGASIIRQPCRISILRSGSSCDHCLRSHLACDGDFIGRDRLVWLLARFYRAHEFDELIEDPFEEDWPSPPASPVLSNHSSLDADYTPSEIDELAEVEELAPEDDIQALFNELFGDEDVPLVAMDEELLHFLQEAIAEAPELGAHPDYPIIID